MDVVVADDGALYALHDHAAVVRTDSTRNIHVIDFAVLHRDAKRCAGGRIRVAECAVSTGNQESLRGRVIPFDCDAIERPIATKVWILANQGILSRAGGIIENDRTWTGD